MSRISQYLFIVLVGVHLIFTGCSKKNTQYTTPGIPWPESFGNHRAVLNVMDKAPVVTADILWRRHDRSPENKRFLIINSLTGDSIENIYRYEVNNERCKIAFGPVDEEGIYHFYYLPYEVQEGWGFYGKDYLKPEEEPDPEWMENNRIKEDPGYFQQAKMMEFQSRTAFDSFYPMEVIPLKSEKDALFAEHTADYLLFPEDRIFPVRMKDEIPYKWILSGPSDEFHGEALKHEYYAFQIGVYAVKKDLVNIKVSFTGLKGKNTDISSSSLTCFNTGGTDPYGNSFIKRIDVSKGQVQVLWLGVDIPESISPGVYKGTVQVIPENSDPQKINIELKITGKSIEARGDNEPWRHSRLRWLNSTLGTDDQPAKGYDPIKVQDNLYLLSCKELLFDENIMASSVKVYGTELLSGPVSFTVETTSGREIFSPITDIKGIKDAPGIQWGEWTRNSENFSLLCSGYIESDGYLNYKYTLKALNDISIKDIRLDIPVNSKISEYMMGMGLPGTTVPEHHEAKWEGPHDSFWIGNTKAGIWCELRDDEYHGPLLNLYHPPHPVSWSNSGSGGFRIDRKGPVTIASVYSGKRDLNKGEELSFEWSMLITPVKKINYKSQFTDRYFHNALAPIPSDEDIAAGVKIVNLHHANNYNPHINYPFIAVDSMKWFVNRLHEKGLKVKIYYTIRELTNYTTELWALRSLGNEILGDGNGEGYPWLREHLIDGYRPQWYQHFPDKSPDASIVNSPGASRWYNYYIEGLAWLVKNVDIDGLYLDDVTYDRRTVKRIRKVMDNIKPGCILDLHSNTGFSKGPANQYAEYFPYIDKLWFGESFMYSNMPPENWLVEVSGIPFGLMGDMLHAGGNRWLGMVYGMTLRLPWLTEGVTCDPRPVWKIWDEFGIESSEMSGYWEKDCPVKTSNPHVLATVYLKEGKSLVSVGNWAEKPETFSLQFDWKKLGIDHAKAVLEAPEIRDFQKKAVFHTGEQILVGPKEGLLLFLSENE